jgi:hypothetical protein
MRRSNHFTKGPVGRKIGWPHEKDGVAMSFDYTEYSLIPEYCANDCEIDDGYYCQYCVIAQQKVLESASLLDINGIRKYVVLTCKKCLHTTMIYPWMENLRCKKCGEPLEKKIDEF